MRCAKEVQLGKRQSLGQCKACQYQCLDAVGAKSTLTQQQDKMCCLGQALGQALNFNSNVVTWNLVAGLELLAVSTSSPVPGISHLLSFAWPCIPEL